MIRCPHCQTEIPTSWLILDTILLLMRMLYHLVPGREQDIDKISDAIESLKDHREEKT